MRRIALLGIGVGLVGWGLAGALGGCGSDDATPATGNDAAASSSGTSGSGTGTNTDEAGSSGSSGAPSDGGLDDGSSSSSSSGSTATPNPGKITCGSVECDAGGGIGSQARCCVRDAGATAACTSAAKCDADDLELQCDEPADCPSLGPKLRCCLHLSDGGLGPLFGKRASCEPGCGGPNGVQLCKANTDCGDGGAGSPTCNPKKCGDYDLHVCGDPAGCQ